MVRDAFEVEMERRMEEFKRDMDAHFADWAKREGIELPELRPTGLLEVFNGP